MKNALAERMYAEIIAVRDPKSFFPIAYITGIEETAKIMDKSRMINAL